ncbi:glycoside hydrolase [Thraustotheca clavata]|uniref:Glycoside hydrolase n=1 Tax=Thraustotheca clavata TaxID=74557 RepID=A0A1V9ZPS9_9STRA|nr:glycoside hydrolase [Thraustotheca clavata]
MRNGLNVGRAALSTLAAPKRSSVASLLGKSFVAVSAALGAGVYYGSTVDEGFARSLFFYTKAMPAYFHYRTKQIYIDDILKLDEKEKDEHYEELHDKYAPTLYDVVLHLKGFYIKLAQIGSTRHDFLPKQYLDRCKILQSDAPSKPIEEIIGIIENAYGKPVSEIFQSIDTKPLGAASIGQVHKAVLHDGRTVVIKVQFPEAEHHFRNDIGTIKTFCKLAQPEQLPFLNEVEKQFMTEFDYRREAANLAEVRANILKSPYASRFVVPEPYLELCNKDVLVMEYLEGKSLLDGIQDHFELIAKEKNTTIEALKAEQERIDAERAAQGLDRESGPSEEEMRKIQSYLYLRNVAKSVQYALYDYTLGWVYPRQRDATTPATKSKQLLNFAEILRLIVEVHGHEIFVDGCFNGDPHPGNIMLLKDGRLGLIDYGQVKHLDKDHRVRLAKLVVSLAEGTDEDVVNAMKNEIRLKTKYMDPFVLEKMGRVMMDRDDRTVTNGENIQLFMEKLGKRDPIVEQSDDFIMAYRVSLLLRGLSYALHYDMSHAKMWKDICKKVIAEAEQDA